MVDETRSTSGQRRLLHVPLDGDCGPTAVGGALGHLMLRAKKYFIQHTAEFSDFLIAYFEVHDLSGEPHWQAVFDDLHRVAHVVADQGDEAVLNVIGKKMMMPLRRLTSQILLGEATNSADFSDQIKQDFLPFLNLELQKLAGVLAPGAPLDTFRGGVDGQNIVEARLQPYADELRNILAGSTDRALTGEISQAIVDEKVVPLWNSTLYAEFVNEMNAPRSYWGPEHFRAISAYFDIALRTETITLTAQGSAVNKFFYKRGGLQEAEGRESSLGGVIIELQHDRRAEHFNVYQLPNDHDLGGYRNRWDPKDAPRSPSRRSSTSSSASVETLFSALRTKRVVDARSETDGFFRKLEQSFSGKVVDSLLDDSRLAFETAFEVRVFEYEWHAIREILTPEERKEAIIHLFREHKFSEDVLGQVDEMFDTSTKEDYATYFLNQIRQKISTEIAAEDASSSALHVQDEEVSTLQRPHR